MPKTAAAWFREEDWALWRSIDPTWFPPTFNQWRTKFSAQLDELAKRGVEIERIIIDPTRFKQWCEANHRQPTSESRRMYAAQRLAIKQTDH